MQTNISISAKDANIQGIIIISINVPTFFCFVFVRSQSLGISVFLEHIYYTDAASRVIKQVNKYTGGEPLDVNIKRMAKPPTDIKVVHPLNQPQADSLSPFPGCS